MGERTFCVEGTRTVVLWPFFRGGQEGVWEVRGPGTRSGRSVVLVSPRAMVLVFIGLELREPCLGRVHPAVFLVLMSWVTAWVPMAFVVLSRGWCLFIKAEERRWMRFISGRSLVGLRGGAGALGLPSSSASLCSPSPARVLLRFRYL